MEMKTKLVAFAKSTNNELFDADYKDGQWMIKAVETHETLENFIDSAKNWTEKSIVKHGTIAGFPFIAYSKMQAARGKERRSLSVVDFGDVRFALDCDLSNF